MQRQGARKGQPHRSVSISLSCLALFTRVAVAALEACELPVWEGVMVGCPHSTDKPFSSTNEHQLKRKLILSTYHLAQARQRRGLVSHCTCLSEKETARERPLHSAVLVGRELKALAPVAIKDERTRHSGRQYKSRKERAGRK
jgi:hypothetical protein